ncbi:MAG: hypothetical protein SFW62_06360 [Alphaproteobacteria bacterium]|nr:hypothetical protein [Alphaproteobacteria bacterium]
MFLRSMFQILFPQMEVRAAMTDDHVSADCFVLKSRNKEIFRITQDRSATLLWPSEIDFMRYIERTYATPLQDNTGW